VLTQINACTINSDMYYKELLILTNQNTAHGQVRQRFITSYQGSQEEANIIP